MLSVYKQFVVNNSVPFKSLLLTYHLFLTSMQRRGRIVGFFLLFLIRFVFGNPVVAQHKRMTTEAYIQKYKKVAIQKMRDYKIPASITLAQGILESGSGNSRLARKANNHFGIKCHKDWHGKRFYMDDDVKRECFRKYKKAAESYRDHSLFLTRRGRYSFLFRYNITDYKKWAYGLKKAGYATNPKYPKLLIQIIHRYHLDQYDKEALEGKRHWNKRTKRTVPPVIADFPAVGNSPNGLYKVYKNNGKRLIIARKNDTYEKIADAFELHLRQLFRYNDVDKKHKIKEGEIIYLQKKRRKPKHKYKIHLVRSGETLQSISQLYGIRLSRIDKVNNLPKGIQVPVGTRLKLR